MHADGDAQDFHFAISSDILSTSALRPKSRTGKLYTIPSIAISCRVSGQNIYVQMDNMPGERGWAVELTSSYSVSINIFKLTPLFHTCCQTALANLAVRACWRILKRSMQWRGYWSRSLRVSIFSFSSQLGPSRETHNDFWTERETFISTLYHLSCTFCVIGAGYSASCTVANSSPAPSVTLNKLTILGGMVVLISQLVM